jgi:hypothetical protein
MRDNPPPARSPELQPLRLRLLVALVTLSLAWAFAPNNPSGGLGLSTFLAPALILYVFAIHSRSGSYLIGWAQSGAVVMGFMVAHGTDDGSGLPYLWVPFLAWVTALIGLALEPLFRRWDREAQSKSN